MKKAFGPSLYFASDKVIFDAMNHTKVTADTIRELLSDRGIIVSSKTPKYELAQFFSRITADYFDHKNIASKLGKIARRERITYAEISESLTKLEIIEALNTVKDELELAGNSVRFEVNGERILALLEYDFIDYTEVEFRQVQARDGIIEFLPDGDGKYVVRSTQNREIDAAVDTIFTVINLDRSDPVKQNHISLEGIPEPEKRCQFFNKLMQSLDQHQLVTVTEAYCFNSRSKKLSDENEDETELEDRSNVERVYLKGTEVNKSLVISDLYDKGYYLVKTVWRVKPESSLDSDVFEIEAQFSEPSSCTDFSYQVRAALIFDDGKLTNKKRTPKSEEQDNIFRLIEAAAKKAYTELL